MYRIYVCEPDGGCLRTAQRFALRLRAQGYTYRRDPLVTPWAWGARSRSFSPPGTWVAFFQLFFPFYIWMLQRSSKREKHDTLTTDLHVGEVIHLQHFRGTSAAHA